MENPCFLSHHLLCPWVGRMRSTELTGRTSSGRNYGWQGKRNTPWSAYSYKSFSPGLHFCMYKRPLFHLWLKSFLGVLLLGCIREVGDDINGLLYTSDKNRQTLYLVVTSNGNLCSLWIKSVHVVFRTSVHGGVYISTLSIQIFGGDACMVQFH